MTFTENNSGNIETWEIVLKVEADIENHDHDGYCSDPVEITTSNRSVIKTFYPESDTRVADFLSHLSTEADDEGYITSD